MQGWTSENVAAQENISRETIDEYALRSHNRAKDAQEKGLFKAEIVSDFHLLTSSNKKASQIPIEALQHTAESAESKDLSKRQKVLVSEDDGLRHTTLEGLTKARPAFPQWEPARTTGGNASQLTDGAAVCLLMSRAKAEAVGAKILAKHVATTVAGLPPRIMCVVRRSSVTSYMSAGVLVPLWPFPRFWSALA
jgi:acetyl-CoA acyltransferase 1